MFRKFFLACLVILMASSAFGAAKIPGVRSYAPSGTVQNNVQIRIVFNNPVVTRANLKKSLTPENPLFPVEINPPLQLEGQWQTPTIFNAKLLAPLQNATTYTAKFKDGLRDTHRQNISGSFRFQTEGLSPTDIQASYGRDGNAYFTLNFNMRIDPNRLKGYMKILNADGREMPYSINGALPSRTIRAVLPVNMTSSRQRFTVKIAAGLRSGEGDMGINNDITENVILDPELVVRGLYPDEDEITASFNFGIDPQTAKSFIQIEPHVDNVTFQPSWTDERLVIRSPSFKPRDRFIITLKKGFPSKTGLVLKDDYKQAVIMPDLDSEVSLPSSGMYLAALDKGLIPIELTNIKKLQLDLWRMYENNIPYALNDYDEFKRDIAKRIFTREIPLNLPLNERVKRTIALDETAQGQRGLFLLTARDTEKGSWSEAQQVINLSDLGATVRLWENAILVWVNTLTTAQPVNEATVKIYSNKKQLLATGKTNSGGVFYYELPEGTTWENDNLPETATASYHEDITFVQLTRNLLNREIFDTAGRSWMTTGYDGAIISPRNIYRTGETASFKAIVRNYDLTTPDAFPVLFTVRDVTGRKVTEQTSTLNARGSAVMELNIPASARTGLWRVSLSIPGGNGSIADYAFHVEDFAPPRIEVNANTYRDYLFRGEEWNVDIYSRWLFGVDAATLKYRASWTARQGEFVPKQERWKGYTFGDSSRRFPAHDGELDEGTLDNFGKATLRLKLDDDWQAPTTINVTMRAEVQQDDGRWIAQNITRPYFPAPYMLGIEPVDETFSVRKDMRFRVAGITPKEEPADTPELSAENPQCCGCFLFMVYGTIAFAFFKKANG